MTEYKTPDWIPLRDGDLVVGPAGFGVYTDGIVLVGGKSFDASEFRKVPPDDLPKAWAAIGWPVATTHAYIWGDDV